MSTIQKMIDSASLWLFAACILPLCLAVPALGTAASPAHLATQTDDLHLPKMSGVIDPPEIPFRRRPAGGSWR